MNAPRMALGRAPTALLFTRFTSPCRSSRSCPQIPRQLSYLHPLRTSSEKIQTTPSYQTYTFPTPPPQTRSDNIPETPIISPTPIPKFHETRPPQQPAQNVAKATPPPPPQATAAAPATTKPAPAPERKRKLRARKAAMKLTPTAVAQLQNLLDQPEPKLIKVGVRNRGCSGLAYHLEFVDKPGAFDEEVVQDGVKVLIDSKALFSIIGSEMDWVEDKLNQRFVFRNPNIKEECGCGESFMV